ncbi:hypothetical protein SAMD00019534_119270 [Acytostelium subglobosum LB1]|uniref:hypothetical protein n=1 Tax=Acytostelium subglobosum LB1 TaxID=1410327 RepID=UPI000644ED30|nr:hypothetical protein SAMD00019534_119270 [Acytostelium subglobosum LB1]GAM28751.1 hypothetical protein SAMD00019534_119270 [Acytostelium subglobosum LB1]|eukprot:XP_012748306.1 hypothetical protein SAMD00019534_119270 [Acytostelium subglobosum LB1]
MKRTVVERERRERERKEKAIRDAIPHCKWSEKTASIHSWTINLRQMMVNTDCTEEELANHMGQLFDEPDRTWYYLLNPRPVTVQTLLEAMNTRFDIASKNIMLRTELEHLHQNGSPIANFNSRYGEKEHTLNMSEEEKVFHYTSRLDPEIRVLTLMMHPANLAQAKSKAVEVSTSLGLGKKIKFTSFSSHANNNSNNNNNSSNNNYSNNNNNNNNNNNSSNNGNNHSFRSNQHYKKPSNRCNNVSFDEKDVETLTSDKLNNGRVETHSHKQQSNTNKQIKKHEQIEEVETSTEIEISNTDTDSVQSEKVETSTEIEISNTDTDSAQSEKVETSPTQTQQTNEYKDKVETKSPNNQSLDNDTKVREPTVKVDTKTNINKELTLDVIPIKIDKRVASAIVDTGANYCLIDPSIIADMKIDISNKETFNIQSPVFENTSTTSNQSVNLEIDINNHKFTMLFVVTPIRAIYKVIIGNNKAAETAAREWMRARELESQFMEEFSDVIVDEITTGLPPARSTDLKLKLIDENKIMRGYPYRKSPKQQEAMDQITKRLYERGAIIPSTAAHGCTANVIWKKDGRPRLIIDFRPVNNNIVTATDNIPRTDDIINRFQSNKWFTDADMIDGYWQCRVSPESSLNQYLDDLI